jgi:uncharacterized protein (DUF433 family)
MGVQSNKDASADRFENFEAGMNTDETMEQFGVTREQVKAVL